MAFYIQRPAVPNQMRQIARWLTIRGGWTTNFADAYPYPSRGDALKRINGRANYGDVVQIPQSLGHDNKPQPAALARAIRS